MNDNVEIIESDAVETSAHSYGEEGAKIEVPADVYRDTKKAVTAQHGVANRWLTAEPGISRTFGAVKAEDGTIENDNCYTKGKPEHKALIEFLTDVHPLNGRYLAAIETVRQLKKNGADAEKVGDAETRRDLIKRKVQLDIGNSMRALKEYFLKDRGGEKAAPKPKTVADMIREFAVKMGTQAEKESVPEAEQKLADKVKTILNALIADPSLSTAMLECIPLPVVAGKITKDWTIPSEVKNVTEEYNSFEEVM